MLFVMKLAPAPVSQTDSNHNVDRRSSQMFAWSLQWDLARKYTLLGSSPCFPLIHSRWSTPFGQNGFVYDKTFTLLGIWVFADLREYSLKNATIFIFQFYNPQLFFEAKVVLDEVGVMFNGFESCVLVRVADSGQVIMRWRNFCLVHALSLALRDA